MSGPTPYGRLTMAAQAVTTKRKIENLKREKLLITFNPGTVEEQGRTSFNLNAN